MNEFKTFHPITNFIYFLFVIIFAMVFIHPICLAISVTAGFIYSVILNGKKALKFNLLYALPMVLITAILNPLFNHEGATVLAYFPSGNPFTLESVIFGVASATMVASVIYWFSCFNEIMTSDKCLYLFGKLIPSLSLVFSGVLRFIPKFKNDLKAILDSHKCLGKTLKGASFVKKIKYCSTIISALITNSFEDALQTADSMKSRGYGTFKRSTYSNQKFDKRDAVVSACVLLDSFVVVLGSVSDKIKFTYYPKISGTGFSYQTSYVFLAYFLLCATPIIIEITEAIKWKVLESKI